MANREHFTINMALHAADVPRAAFVTWKRRGQFVFTDQDRRAEGTGHLDLLSFDSVLVLTVAARLIRAGVQASVAFKMADGARKGEQGGYRDVRLHFEGIELVINTKKISEEVDRSLSLFDPVVGD